MMLFLKFLFGICFCMWLYITLTWIEGAIFTFKFIRNFFSDKAFIIVELPKTHNSQAELWTLVGSHTNFIYLVSSKEKCLELYAKLDAIKKKHNL